MPYKISGNIDDAARILVLDQTSWGLEQNVAKSAGSYTIITTSGVKIVIAASDSKGVISYKDVLPVFYSVAYSTGIFAAGSYTNVIDKINISSPGNATDFGDLSYGAQGLAAASNGNNGRGIIAGGNNTGSAPYKSDISFIEIENSSNATLFGYLVKDRCELSACSNKTNQRGIFAGSISSSGGGNRDIDYITISTASNATGFGNLLVLIYDCSSTSNATGNRGVVSTGAGAGNVIEYITISTLSNSVDFGDITVARSLGGATSNDNNNRALFGGGGSLNTIDYITITTTGNATYFGDLSISRSQLTATSNGTNDTGVFAGGSGALSVIEKIVISSTSNSTNFGNLTVGRLRLCSTSNA